MGDYAGSILLFGATLFGASALSIFSAGFLMNFVRFFVKDGSTQDIICVMLMLAIFMLVLLLVCKRQGYYLNNSHYNAVKIFIISSGISLFIYTGIGFLSDFYILFYPQGFYTSDAFINGFDGGIEELINDHYGHMTLIYFITLVPLIIAMAAGFYIGYKNRADSRKKLTGKA